MLKNVAFTWLAMHLPKWIHQLLSSIHTCRYSAGEYQNYYIIYMLARRLNKSTSELYVNHTTMCIHVQVSNQSTMSKRSRRWQCRHSSALKGAAMYLWWFIHTHIVHSHRSQLWRPYRSASSQSLGVQTIEFPLVDHVSQ